MGMGDLCIGAARQAANFQTETLPTSGAPRLRRLFAGGDPRRLRETPCVVESAISPGQRIEEGARRGHRHALPGNVLQRPLALGRGFGAEPFRGILQLCDDRRIGCRCGVLRGIEPGSERLGAGLEACRSLPAADRRRDACQVVMKLPEYGDSVPLIMEKD